MGSSALEWSKGEAGVTGPDNTGAGPTGPSAGSAPTGPSVTGPTGPHVTGPTGPSTTGPTGPSAASPTGPDGARGGSGDFYAFRKSGTSKYEAWYSMPSLSVMTSFSSATGRIYALPFPCPKQITMDYIGIYCSGAGGGGSIDLAVYSDTGVMYPGNLQFDTGDLAVATGVLSSAVSFVFTPGLWWLAIMMEKAGNTFYGFGVSSVALDILGITNTLSGSYNSFLYKAVTYANGIPATFPSGATINTSLTAPGVCVRRSA